MKIALKTLLTFFLLGSSQSIYADQCPESYGTYGDRIQYQNLFCKVMIKADKTDSKSYRNITFTDEGQIQVFSNFPGTTNSNSTGARVYYLFPLTEKKSVLEANSKHLSMRHPSGVIFDFDAKGRLSSPDIKITMSKEINSKNKGGIEIEPFSKGLLIDLGYRMGASPVNSNNSVVTITDKNNIKCTMPNSEFNKIVSGEAELRYKSNSELHNFLAKKCPKLDISDLLKPLKNEIDTVISAKTIGAAPEAGSNDYENDTKRDPYPDAKIKDGKESKEEKIQYIKKGTIQK